MELVHRSRLQEKVNEEIQQNVDCDKMECDCFEDIMETLDYSILSHRWGSHELTFDELQNLDAPSTKRDKASSTIKTRREKMEAKYKGSLYEASLSKLFSFLHASERRECEYAWVDTLCIDKKSSAELDESIRSMYAWYRDSYICIVHLSETNNLWSMQKDPWFSRGWTLQELLAPTRITFFSEDWKQLTREDCDKLEDKEAIEADPKRTHEGRLWSTISEITTIPLDDLLDFKPGLYDIRKRMTWASRRETTRIEDIAYCMLGIFCVNVPISYGEREGAFYRLQAEIMQNTDDRSLFHWEGEASAYNSMFASSPKCFSYNAIGKPSTVHAPPLHPDNRLLSANYTLRMQLALFDELTPAYVNKIGAPTATAVAILGPSKDEKHFLVALEEIEDSGQYKRLKVWSTKVDGEWLDGEPQEVIIK